MYFCNYNIFFYTKKYSSRNLLVPKLQPFFNFLLFLAIPAAY